MNNNDLHDPIIAEVRGNREELLQDFNGDIHKLDQHIKSQRSKWEVKYESESEQQERIAWHKKQQEMELKRIANL